MKKIAIITGASSGMGKEFSKQIAAWKKLDEMWLIARRLDRLNETSLEVKKINGNIDVKCISLDLTDRNCVEQFASLLEDSDNNDKTVVDVLVNNAGYGTYGEFVNTSLDRQLGMIDVNIYALTGFCYKVIPYLQKSSTIINVASLASFHPLGNFAVYGASKSYVLSFSVALAAELKDKGIFVETLCPGPVDTEFANVASKGARVKVLHGKSPSDVVRHCIKCVNRKKYISVMAFSWKCKAFLSHVTGRFLVARYTFLYNKRPSN